MSGSPDVAEAMVAEAERLAAAEGLRGIAMRRIAAALGISPGTIYYRLGGGLDDLVLRVNARTLRRLRAHLRACVSGANPAADALSVADGYVGFVMAQPRLWGLLFEHTMPAGKAQPEWYARELALTLALVDEVLAPLVPDPAERRMSVTALWAALQGIASLAASGKLAAAGGGDPAAAARLLVGRYLGVDPRGPA